MTDERDIAVPAANWKPVPDQLVMVFVVHPNAAYAEPEDLHLWRGWFLATWTRFNGGGWVWHGMVGTVTHVRPLPPVPAGLPRGRARTTGGAP